jgi:acyl-CoA synthetase (NDP forming)
MEVDFSQLDRAFNPHCVAVVGDKEVTNFGWLRGQQHFAGKLYSVQVDPNEIDGIKALGVENYSSLLEIPEPVDLVIVAVPRAVAPYILEDCIGKQVGAAHFFTSGFAETDSKDGIRLERLLTERAREANLHLIGPNCMGIFVPNLGIRQSTRQYTGVNGPVGFISQSGAHAITFSEEAHRQGVDINKSVSFGNGVVLDSTDYLAYFGRDPDIKAIGMYLEGVKDGRRFLQTLKEVTAEKPVVIWKGGRTEDGSRVMASHTGSLAVSMAIWDAAMKQGGAVKVRGVDELIDTLKAILYLSPVYGNRVGVTGGSGGQSVAVADVFTEAGLSVPPLTRESYDELASFFTLIGASYRNPIDTGNMNRRQMTRILELLEQDANLDNLAYLITTGARSSGQLEEDVNALIGIRNRTSKPVMAILGFSAPEEIQATTDMLEKLRDGGIPTFPSLERSARAFGNALEAYRIKTNRQHIWEAPHP